MTDTTPADRTDPDRDDTQDRDDLLRRARKTLVRQYDATIRASSEDWAGRHGYHVRVDGYGFVLVAKGRRHEGQVSVSKPALASALRAGEWVLLWDRADASFLVLDPEYVSREGTERYVESKRADEVGVRDMSPDAGVSLEAFVRNDRPPTVESGRQGSL